MLWSASSRDAHPGHDLLALLKELSELHGPSGREEPVGRRVAALLEPYCDSIRHDALGNCIAFKQGTGPGPGPRIMLAAHMDEIGLIVTRVEEGGFLRFAGIGTLDPRALVAQEVVVHADAPLPGYIGVKPPHLLDAAEREKAIPIEEMFIDVGMPEEEVRRRIPPGTFVTLRRDLTPLLGTRVAGKALDNRASVAALVETMRLLRRLHHAADVYAVATVQEEVGLRGAMVSTFGIVPDMAVAIDVGFAPQPGLPEDRVFPMGKGPAVAFGANIHPRLFSMLVDVAKENNIPHQIEPMPAASGTDAWAMQVTASGVPTALVSIPLRYMHTSVEVVDLEDIRQTARLLAHLVASLTAADREGWRYDLT